MRSPYGLQIIESCVTCPVKEQRLFCNLPKGTLEALQSIKSTATYPKGAMLFVEGQESRGAFILCRGKAKLYTSSSDGRAIILRIAQPGEVLGLTSTIGNKTYEATAEILEPSQINFLPKKEFLHFLTEHGEASLHVGKQLSANCASAYDEIRCLGLSASSIEKLARMLLSWAAPETKPGANEARVTLSLTHEEIAQMIGASRETVTRIFSALKKKNLVSTKGAMLWIRDVKGLRQIVAS